MGTAIILILIFIFERVFSHYSKKVESNLEWYLTVLVQPNLNKIQNHFESIHSDFKKHHAILKSFNGNEKENLQKYKASIFQSIKEKNRAFSYSFLVPIETRYRLTYIFLSKIIESLEDTYTKGLDMETLDNEGLELFEQELSKLTGNFYTKLYQPLEYEQNFFKNIFSQIKPSGTSHLIKKG